MNSMNQTHLIFPHKHTDLPQGKVHKVTPERPQLIAKVLSNDHIPTGVIELVQFGLKLFQREGDVSAIPFQSLRQHIDDDEDLVFLHIGPKHQGILEREVFLLLLVITFDFLQVRHFESKRKSERERGKIEDEIESISDGYEYERKVLTMRLRVFLIVTVCWPQILTIMISGLLECSATSPNKEQREI